MKHLDPSKVTVDHDGSMQYRGAFRGHDRVKVDPDGHVSEVEWNTPVGRVIVHLHRPGPFGPRLPSLEIVEPEERFGIDGMRLRHHR